MGAWAWHGATRSRCPVAVAACSSTARQRTSDASQVRTSSRREHQQHDAKAAIYVYVRVEAPSARRAVKRGGQFFFSDSTPQASSRASRPFLEPTVKFRARFEHFSRTGSKRPTRALDMKTRALDKLSGAWARARAGRAGRPEQWPNAQPEHAQLELRLAPSPTRGRLAIECRSTLPGAGRPRPATRTARVPQRRGRGHGLGSGARARPSTLQRARATGARGAPAGGRGALSSRGGRPRAPAARLLLGRRASPLRAPPGAAAISPQRRSTRPPQRLPGPSRGTSTSRGRAPGAMTAARARTVLRGGGGAAGARAGWCLIGGRCDSRYAESSARVWCSEAGAAWCTCGMVSYRGQV